jgi:hypothetical protein
MSESRVAAEHVKAEPALRPTTSAGAAADEATGPTSVAVVAAETADARAAEAPDAGVSHGTSAADHLPLTIEEEGIAEVILGKWKDAREGASSASRKDTSRRTAQRGAAEEEMRGTVLHLAETDAETSACRAAMAEMAPPAATFRGAARHQETVCHSTSAGSIAPGKDGNTALVRDGTTVHATANGTTVLVTEVLHPVATTEKTAEALAT